MKEHDNILKYFQWSWFATSLSYQINFAKILTSK